MKKLNLNNFKKTNTKQYDHFITSVSITRDQQRFIEKNSLNLSKLLRELLDVLITENNKGDK